MGAGVLVKRPGSDEPHCFVLSPARLTQCTELGPPLGPCQRLLHSAAHRSISAGPRRDRSSPSLVVPLGRERSCLARRAGGGLSMPNINDTPQGRATCAPFRGRPGKASRMARVVAIARERGRNFRVVGDSRRPRQRSHHSHAGTAFRHSVNIAQGEGREEEEEGELQRTT